ncbi:hypothetical protein ROLI_024630 [Roseobacter fucihabitans]|uniref:Uncharacterized protein n=1 Tax=Roseobacter fucihabitans TaxID=1537242 RepID=A0ABZ2BTP7_9RHOB|nr:hypothetical protein [Roseobacter litoralis]MBC6965232.1 hypothetical protein [Roseobacter litoralis]
MDNNPFFIAGGGLVVGVLLAVAISESRANSKISAALERAQGASAVTLSEATQSLNERIGTLEAGLAESTASAAASMEEQLAALQQDVSTRFDAVSEAASAQAEAFQAALSGPTPAASDQTPAVPGDATIGMQTSGVLSVGETAIFAQGAVRAFVSGLDRDGGAARLSVNGVSKAVSLGETVAVSGSDCSIGITSLDSEGVIVGSDCGMAQAAATAPLPPAPEDGYGPGTMAMLADGALRVFVSGLAGDGSSARIAINGIETQTVAAGGSVEAMAGDQNCTVTVTGVGNGMVGLEGGCS